MKKTIAKFLNAVRDRRDKMKSTTKIEVGEIYHVKHTIRNDFYIRVDAVNDAWVEGLALSRQTLEEIGETIAMRSLCTFTKLKGIK